MTFKDGRAVQSSRKAIAKAKRENALVYSTIFLAILFLFYGSLYTLWMVNPVLYHEIIRVLIVGLPGDHPFTDTTGWLSWLECRERGVNVLVSNPCDILHDLNATLNYSPLLLDLPTWFRMSDTQALGLAQASAFLLTLPFLFRPSSLYELCTACLAALSTSVIFAVERANMDILIFTLVAVAVFLRGRRGALRFSPYAIFIAGGMLKFYPLVLLSTSLRERPRVFLAVVATSAAIITGVAVVHRTELETILKSLPPFIVWGDTFGARELPIGLAYFFPSFRLVPLASIEIVSVAFLYFAVRIFIGLRNEKPAFQWRDSRSEFLILGSLLIVGCFFFAVNAGYRAIFLLFLLPGLKDVAAHVSQPGLKRVVSVSQIAIVLLLWKDFLRQCIEALLRPTGNEHGLAELPYLLFFVFRELTWWFVISVALAIAALLFSRSQTFQWTLSLLHREPKAAT